MKVITKFKIGLRLLMLLAFLSNVFYSQGKGGLTGIVSDQSNGESLYGANVFIDGTAIGTATDLEGKYRITGLEPGKYLFVFRYLGFETKKEEVDIVAGRMVQMDVKLGIEAVTGEEVVVTGQLQGQAAAINQQITSNTIVNVVSKDKIEELPDANVAESIGRLPGISIQRNAGEGSKVVVRGLSPKFNSITVNGERIPATDPNDRSVDLSMISQDILAGIEVFKALTPDKDADAIGGTINLVTKNAPSNFEFDVRVQGGYNNHESDFGIYKTSISGSNRYLENNLGVLATFSAQRANRGSDLLDAQYLSPTSQNPVIEISDLNLVDRIETRDRYSAGLNFDFNFLGGDFKFNNFYSRTERDEIRRRKRYRVDAFRVEYDIRERQINTDLVSSTLLGKYNFGSADIDFQISYSNSERNTPYSNYARFQEIGAYNNGLNPNLGPTVIPGFAKNTLSETFYQYGTFNPQKVKDRDFTAQFNTKYNFTLANNFAGYVKSGLKYRDKNRVRQDDEFRTDFGVTDDIAEDNPGMFEMFNDHIAISNFIDADFETEDFLDGRYEFGPGLNNDQLDDFYQTFKSYYTQNRFTDLNDYDAGESIFAAYIMSEINITNNLMILPGIRFEKTENDYDGKFGDLRGNLGQEGTIIDTVGGQSYEEWLPMVHVKYTFVDGLDLRFAYTETISRPDYFNLVPFQRISESELTLVKGNPGLKHTNSRNYDAYLSLYNNYGLFSVGAYYKELKNIDYLFTFRETQGEFRNYSVTEPINSPEGEVYGFEVEVQTNLRFLPSPFDGIVISGNYSIIKSETQFPFFEIGPRSTEPPFSPTIIKGFRKGRLPGQADKIINVSLGYEKGGFSGRISLLHQGEITESIGTRSESDIYTAAFTRVDMSLSQKFLDNFSIFANINNLTDLSEGSFFGAEEFPIEEQFFGWTADLGIRFRFK